MEVNLSWPSQDELLSPWCYCLTCNDLRNPNQVNNSILWCVWEIMCGLIIPIIPITSQSHLIHSHLPTRLWGIRTLGSGVWSCVSEADLVLTFLITLCMVSVLWMLAAAGPIVTSSPGVILPPQCVKLDIPHYVPSTVLIDLDMHHMLSLTQCSWFLQMLIKLLCYVSYIEREML